MLVCARVRRSLFAGPSAAVVPVKHLGNLVAHQRQQRPAIGDRRGDALDTIVIRWALAGREMAAGARATARRILRDLSPGGMGLDRLAGSLKERPIPEQTSTAHGGTPLHRLRLLWPRGRVRASGKVG